MQRHLHGGKETVDVEKKNSAHGKKSTTKTPRAQRKPFASSCLCGDFIIRHFCRLVKNKRTNLSYFVLILAALFCTLSPTSFPSQGVFMETPEGIPGTDQRMSFL